MVSLNQISSNNSFEHRHIDRGEMKKRPGSYVISTKEHDKLRNPGFWTKTKINIENIINTPGYVYRGMKGDPDFNFYEYLRVAKVPYFLGGLGLAAVAACGNISMLHFDKNNFKNTKGIFSGISVSKIPHFAQNNSQISKRILLGVIMYYIAREAANAVINIPMKIFRGIDLNRPYRKITSLREGNPLNLPNNKKPSNQGIFDSSEFTRWDLLYKYGAGKNTNEIFDKLAKKFGADKKLKDSDSGIISKIRKLMIMATSWKYMLSVPFVTLGLGLAQQQSYERADFVRIIKDIGKLFLPSTNNRFSNVGNSINENLFKPTIQAFKDLWKGGSVTSKIFGRGAIIGAIGLSILANMMILYSTSLKHDKNAKIGGQK